MLLLLVVVVVVTKFKATPYRLNVQLKSAHGFVDGRFRILIRATLDVRGQFGDFVLHVVGADAGNWFP